MKKSRYTDRRIIAILRQAEAGTPVPELCREHGMSSAFPSRHGYECRLPRCTRRRDQNIHSRFLLAQDQRISNVYSCRYAQKKTFGNC